MGRAAYGKRTCKCGREISAAGCAWHNHMMMHVRRGEAKATQPYRDFVISKSDTYVFEWIKEPAKLLPVNPVLNLRTYNP